MSCGAVTLSWFARRMLRFDRVVRRFGTATALLLLFLCLHPQKRGQTRVDRFGSLFWVGRGNTRAILGAQGDHGDFEQQIVTDEVVEDDVFPVVWQDCLLYTSDAADERSSVDLGGRRII